MVRPRVTPPLRAFFRLSITSVSSSSRLTRSSSRCLQSSSTFFSCSDSEAWARLPNGGGGGGVSVYWVRRLRISCFLFISSSSLACSRLASASTRFFPLKFSWDKQHGEGRVDLDIHSTPLNTRRHMASELRDMSRDLESVLSWSHV
ncbi:hypothetical protein EYF80_044060 [Liparis tanakae]|uniref:Uncharacterized protein n=1 Tax=Liparis tanakae TaxID=230148 RepID=A0A4Z2FXY6_9TELE|nr:hypothetical protein EYF80_044060 [Liparis tanakae]